MIEDEVWSLQLDWLNIISIIGLDIIDQIPEIKRGKVIKKITKLYGAESLLSFKPMELDELVANELRDLMKKELQMRARQKERIARQMKAKMAPFKNPGVMRIDMNQMKDLPDEIKKFILNQKNDKEQDEDDDKYSEDKNSYYI